MKNFLFTSESVSEGHPDKVSDQISDALLDAFKEKDPNAHVACEVLVTTDYALIAGEVSEHVLSQVDAEKVVRDTIRKIGYTHEDIGFNADTVQIHNKLHQQSSDISQGVNEGQGRYEEQGAGDQGLMFGYAIRDTDVLMPAPITYAHRLMEQLAEVRRQEKVDFLRPDSKSQVTLRFEKGKPVALDALVISTQHTEAVSDDKLREAITDMVVKKVFPKKLWQSLAQEKYYINPTGRFVIGGPHGDTGLTGRKIIVDTYGGWSRHGGGAFSGKDPSKVDRSAAYMARYIAKNIVAAKLAERCEVQLAYAIGVAEPVSVLVDTFGTGKISDKKISKKVRKAFRLKPKDLIQSLDLFQISYLPVASYGHFGREGLNLPWEKTDMVQALKDA
jgi:S-adenosylmethionine synthetase